MPICPIRTDRMTLLPATEGLLTAAGLGAEALSSSTGVRVGINWPPDLFDRDATDWYLDGLRADPMFAQWGLFFMVLRDTVENGSLIVGVAGFKGPPIAGKVEIGFSVMESYRRRGLATEATKALVRVALSNPDVVGVIAHTLPELRASIGVLRSCGFSRIGPAEEHGQTILRFERRASLDEGPEGLAFTTSKDSA